MLRATVYESILVQNYVCEIEVLDTDDTLGKLKVLGDEMIELSFSAPGTPVLDYVFAMDKMTLEAFPGSEKTKKWTLHGVGRETLAAKAIYIQKSYNTDIASIVSDIHSNFLNSVKTLATEATEGIQKIIIPNLKPFDAIDMVRRRASSGQNAASNFLYFENADGYHFKTIQGMLSGGVVKSFQHSDALGTSIFNNTIDNIIDYEVPQLFSSSERIDLGGLTQRTATYDLRTRKYNYQDQTLNTVGGLSSVFGKAFNLFSFLPFDSSGRGNTFLPQSTPLQLAGLANMLQCYIVLQVYGDTRVKAGDVIYCNIPESVSTTSPYRNPDPLLTRNYLVSRIARHIGTVNERPRYLETIEGITGDAQDG
jgi:hypothetical protein